MLDADTKEFISQLVSEMVREICSTFGCTGIVPNATPQPGALEIVSDALCEGNWSNGIAVGKGLDSIAHSIGDLAEAVNNVAEELHQANQKDS